MNKFDVSVGDCLQVLPSFDDKSVDVVLVDPPYGLGFPYDGYDDTRENLKALIDGFLPHAIRIARKRVLILCGVTQITLYPNPLWTACVSWTTTHSYGKYGFGQWCPLLCYGKDVKGMGRVNGILKSDVLCVGGGRDSRANKTESELRHPCPKPLRTMRLVLKRFVETGSLVLDPMMGIGTTGVACMVEGYDFIGIDTNEEYVEIGRTRIEEARNNTTP